MQSKTGTVSSIKILKFSEQPLVYFKLNSESCLIAFRSLSFLSDVDNGMRISVAGEYNKRKQFVVKKFAVIGKTKIMMDFESVEMPRKKVLV